MSLTSNRKLQKEIDNTLKRIVEGIEEFGVIWDKVHAASHHNLKEKYEADLKKEIKKLQRYRDQVKSWASSNEVKNTKPLIDARKSIENEMERFKVLEKETKTKAYSKEGLQKSLKRKGNKDPSDDPKYETYQWIDEYIGGIQEQQEGHEDQLQSIKSSKSKSKSKKKSSRHSSDDMEEAEKWIERHSWHIQQLQNVKDRLRDDELTIRQVDSLQEQLDYYLESNQEPSFYYDEFMYDALDEMISESDEEKEKESSSSSSSESDTEEKRIAQAEMDEKQRKLELKRQAKAQAATPLPQVSANAVAAPAAKIEKKKKKTDEATESKNSEADEKKTSKKKTKKSTPPPALTTSSPAPDIGYAHNTAAASKAPTPPQPKPSSESSAQPSVASSQSDEAAVEEARKAAAAARARILASVPETYNTYLQLMEPSLQHVPPPLDTDRQKTYVPRNPYRTLSCFPNTPGPMFDDPSIFERFSTDTLFFIFYFQQGTPHQYLAARELKKHSWRYHSHYLTWFQRHDDPKRTTEEYEQGTYVFFDYEQGWCHAIKPDFMFEYRHLEDG